VELIFVVVEQGLKDTLTEPRDLQLPVRPSYADFANVNYFAEIQKASENRGYSLMWKYAKKEEITTFRAYQQETGVCCCMLRSAEVTESIRKQGPTIVF
jgi:hypothetical protein